MFFLGLIDEHLDKSAKHLAMFFIRYAALDF